MKDCYTQAKDRGEGDKGPYSYDENIADSAYSLYNSGSAYFRYRTSYEDAKSIYKDTDYGKYIEGYYNGPRDDNGIDMRDVNYRKHYENKSWE